MENYIFLALMTLLFLLSPILFGLCREKTRKIILKNIKKANKDYTFKTVLEEIRILPIHLVYGAVESYEENKDFLINLVVNIFVVRIVLGIIENIPEGNLKMFTSFALVAHLAMWFVWSMDKAGFFYDLPKEMGEDYFASIIGYFLMAFFGIFLINVNLILLGQITLLFSIIAIVLNISRLMKEVIVVRNKKKREKKK